MGVGSNKMVDLDFVEAGLDERSPPSAPGSNSRQASASTRFTNRQKALTRARACENDGNCCSPSSMGPFPMNCDVLKQDWRSSKDAGSIFRVMKRSLRVIFVCLLVFTLLAATELAEAGPFEDFFRSVRNSFARPAPKPRPPQSRQTSRKQNNETPPSDASDASNSQTSPSPTPAPAPPNRSN